jgi:Flp pilus assembly protein TadB
MRQRPKTAEQKGALSEAKELMLHRFPRGFVIVEAAALWAAIGIGWYWFPKGLIASAIILLIAWFRVRTMLRRYRRK